MTDFDPGALKRALHERLVGVARAFDLEIEPDQPTSRLLNTLVMFVRDRGGASHAWLLFIGIAAAFPRPVQLEEFRRLLALSSAGGALVAALEATIDAASRPTPTLRALEIVTGVPVVDVNFCATNEHNTGIQRVVRETLPHWQSDETAHRLVAWNHDSSGLRDLDEIETDRVLHWHDRRLSPTRGRGTGKAAADSEERETLVVPWRTHVFLPEVPFPHLCSVLACLAESSGNTVSAIGYDAIPLVSADTQNHAESERFAHYLTLVKHSRRIVAISESAAEEFRGFVDALRSQGVTGPLVEACPLAVDIPASALGAEPVPSEKPLVLCVGSHEPRKNQDAVLAAAEELYREGLDFRMVFVGGGSLSATREFDSRVRKLRRRGYDVVSLRGLKDRDLWGYFKAARFTVFVSLHEGFGLPVAESLALGKPVLTSDFGSLREIAVAGGCVMVDPRDDDQITAGMRSLLRDDALIERLGEDAKGLTLRSWNQYAAALWDAAGLGEAVR